MGVSVNPAPWREDSAWDDSTPPPPAPPVLGPCHMPPTPPIPSPTGASLGDTEVDSERRGMAGSAIVIDERRARGGEGEPVERCVRPGRPDGLVGELGSTRSTAHTRADTSMSLWRQFVTCAHGALAPGGPSTIVRHPDGPQPIA
jgi:hypothetical protein